MRAASIICAFAAVAAWADQSPASKTIHDPPVARVDQSGESLRTMRIRVPAAAAEMEFVLVPGDEARNIAPFWLSRTEVTWDVYDVFVYRLDGEHDSGEQGSGVDAISRPSKPYLPPDRGYGHEGFAAICIASRAAEGFCEWLSARTERKVRLISEDEWEHAARAGAPVDQRFSWGNDPVVSAEHAWTSEHSGMTPRAAGKGTPNAWGVFDMHGNVREWVRGRDGQMVCKGGGFRDRAEDCTIQARWPYDKAWNATDPQIPKSKWWLSDGDMIGFRVACEYDREKDEKREKPGSVETNSSKEETTK